MKRIILALLFACLSVGTIANAAETTTTEVNIAIEASEEAVADIGNDSQKKDKTGGVQTGDDKNVLGYLLAAGVAVGFGAVYAIKKKRKGLIAAFAVFASLFLMNHPVYAAEGTENVNVTIPSSISVCFDETGENSISEFAISNHSLVPITIDKVKVRECNDWTLCEEGETIPLNTKKMAFSFEDRCLKAEENILGIAIAEESNKSCNIHVKRGAWTTSAESETALQLEFEYTIGRKQFQLSYDTNGGTQTVPAQMVYNGDTVVLPSIQREGYALEGWEDSEGTLYTDNYVMPIGNVTLKARWREEVAYAIYVASDMSLRFIRTAEPIAVGYTYKGMTVSDVFTGFENTAYQAREEVPWYDGMWYNQRNVKKVIVEDTIQPISTAYWFDYMDDCEYLDLRKLDTSKVTNMTFMFSWTGFNMTNFTLLGVENFDTSNVTNMSSTFAYTARDAKSVKIDLSSWDVSKVTTMYEMFRGMCYFSTEFRLGDLSKWDVSNVTNMHRIFQQTAPNASWYLDCRGWNVSKVTDHYNFDFASEGKVADPYWVY